MSTDVPGRNPLRVPHRPDHRSASAPIGPNRSPEAQSLCQGPICRGSRWDVGAVRSRHGCQDSDGAQVAAEAMPYISPRRVDCNPWSTSAPGGCRAVLPLAPGGALAVSRAIPVGSRSHVLAASAPKPREVAPVSVDHQVRAARITDIDRLVALCGEAMSKAAADGPIVVADLLRQLVYLPQASVLVAEVRRSVIGVAILALRPSVRSGGFVGTIDVLVVDPATTWRRSPTLSPRKSCARPGTRAASPSR